MTTSQARSEHTFFIPVMGTGFTIDTPLRVARYGISSVMALADDILIEKMRKFHCEANGELYEEIKRSERDFRAHRITAYLNLMDCLIQRQVHALTASPFEAGSEITRYFELLPECLLKKNYRAMLETPDVQRKAALQGELRRRAVPGNIDVNIMTKLDRDTYRNGKKQAPEFSDAMAALRGYAQSTLRSSSIIFSAGMNPRLYSYLAQFSDFQPDEHGELKKKIILKVSDYRSAAIQGKYLAKRGLWISEFRVESGLNCGGHAFPAKGMLMGPILEEFKEKREALRQQLFAIYAKTSCGTKQIRNDEGLPQCLTAQGGIGTSQENTFLHARYEVDHTGWGTPFLLVPEATNVDDAHLIKLTEATEPDVVLSNQSPLGVPFWMLKNSQSEADRLRRIQQQRPGSPCPKGILVTNTEYSKVPVCLASRYFQKRKLAELEKQDLSEKQADVLREETTVKSCLCRDLSAGATTKLGVEANGTTAVCCGPNIVNFSKIASLKSMLGHIYGNHSILTNPKRPHMFIRELALYIDFLDKELTRNELGLSHQPQKYFLEFMGNLHNGIAYYRNLERQLSAHQQMSFGFSLNKIIPSVKKLDARIKRMSESSISRPSVKTVPTANVQVLAGSSVH